MGKTLAAVVLYVVPGVGVLAPEAVGQAQIRGENVESARVDVPNDRHVPHALVAVIGNMFKGKGQRPYEYPKEPYTLDLEYEEGLDMSDDAEKDIALKRRNFVTQLNNLFRDIEPIVERKKKDAEH